MVTKKYVSDYKFSESVTEKGRIKTEAVYTGRHFRLSDAAAKKAARPMLRMLGALWILFVSALVPKTGAARLMYVLLPYAFIAVALGKLTQAVLTLRDADEILIRSEADRVSKQLPASAVWLAILSGVPLVGLAVTLLINKSALCGADAFFAFVCAAELLAGLCVIRKRKVFSTEETD